MSSDAIASDIDVTFKLQIIIGEIINDTISNWDTSRSKITIESFKWRSNCLVLLKLRRLKSKHHYIKCAIIIHHNKPEDLEKLKKILSIMQSF